MPCEPRVGKAPDTGSGISNGVTLPDTRAVGLNLITEYFAAQTAIMALPRSARRRLEELGVSGIAIELGLVGVASIQIHGRDLYQPVDAGPRTVIVPVRVDNPWTPEAMDFEAVPEFGDLIDLVAFHPTTPNRWATRRGAASWLGAIAPQFCSPPPVIIRKTPLSWLQAGTDGLCLLAREPLDRYRIVSVCRALEAEDHDQMRELRRVLERPFATPPITVNAAGSRTERASNHG